MASLLGKKHEYLTKPRLWLQSQTGNKEQAKNDKIDANKIARLLRGGNFPLSYPYPKGMPPWIRFRCCSKNSSIVSVRGGSPFVISPCPR